MGSVTHQNPLISSSFQLIQIIWCKIHPYTPLCGCESHSLINHQTHIVLFQSCTHSCRYTFKILQFRYTDSVLQLTKVWNFCPNIFSPSRTNMVFIICFMNTNRQQMQPHTHVDVRRKYCFTSHFFFFCGALLFCTICTYLHNAWSRTVTWR